MTFDGAIPDPTGCAGVEIFEIDQDGNDVGANLAPSFTCSADGSDTLRVEESGTILENEKWYRVSFCEATVTYASVKGNANQDGFTDFGDLSFIFANQSGAAAGFVDFGDLSAAFSFQGSTRPARPSSPNCPQ